MSAFAEFEPNRPVSSGRVAPAIAAATADDLACVAALAAARDGGTVAHHHERLREQLAKAPEHGRLFVARCDDVIVAFARTSRLALDGLPEGWYLTGVVVTPAHRRRGIGRALVEHRLGWLRERTDVAFFFASAENRASIALHAQLGFREIRRNIVVPGCTFTGGIGVLYERRLDRPQPAARSPQPD